MKIYTKTGDKGETGLFGGARLQKDELRIEAYGTVDELNSYIGLVRDSGLDDDSIQMLISIQDRLFTIGSQLASDPSKSNLQVPQLFDSDITALEKEIDRMNEELPEMRSFVLPGGHPLVSHCHVARCICRRAERRVVSLAKAEAIPALIIPYLNRLSDYLFVLSRWATKLQNAAETPWVPKM